jgi:hypothetical protein
MNTYDDLGQLLRVHLAERANARPAEGALEAVLELTTRIRPRPAWLASLRGGSMGSATLVGPSRRLAVALLLTIGLLAAIILGALLGGAFRLATPTLPHRNGPIVVDLSTGQRVAVDPVTGAANDFGLVSCTPGGSLCSDARIGRFLGFEAGGTSVSWSPDGTKLASQYNGAVWVEDVTTQALFRVTSGIDRSVLAHGIVSWSPDGSHLAFSDLDLIYTVRIDGLQLTPIDTHYMTYTVSQPAWSPDGSRIAFVVASSYGASTIDTIKVDGTDHRTIVPLELKGQALVSRSSPVWAPDGSRIAYLEERPAGAQVVTIRPDGSGRTVIFTVASCCITNLGDVTWSPDGTRIATILGGSDRRGWSLYVMDASGAHAVELLRGVIPGFPAWRPLP